MRRAMLSLAVLGLAAAADEIPAGTEIHVRLTAAVSSRASKAGDAVEALVIVPVLDGTRALLAGGERLRGHVRKAQPAGPEGEPRAMLELEFGEWRGKKLRATVAAVDNARETVDQHGRIVGLLASETLTAQMDRGIEKLGERAGRLAEFLQVAKAALLNKADVDIVYEPGVELTLRLDEKLSVEQAGEVALPPVPDLPALDALVNSQPFQTVAEKPAKPSDITNLMFIGSRERLEKAFHSAGWHTAAELNAASGLETVRAVIENRGYKEAPMSVLLLDGRKPDLVFQKQNNTFAKRHHLRIWRRPAEFQGLPVWVCAATHDIGIEFSMENRTFIHKIDPEVDRERAKVVNDLLLTGMVKGLALVPRPAVPRQASNATGDEIRTDGAMAVLLIE